MDNESFQYVFASPKVCAAHAACLKELRVRPFEVTRPVVVVGAGHASPEWADHWRTPQRVSSSPARASNSHGSPSAFNRASEGHHPMASQRRTNGTLQTSECQIPPTAHQLTVVKLWAARCGRPFGQTGSLHNASLRVISPAAPVMNHRTHPIQDIVTLHRYGQKEPRDA